jgi:hypothetical protein
MVSPSEGLATLPAVAKTPPKKWPFAPWPCCPMSITHHTVLSRRQKYGSDCPEDCSLVRNFLSSTSAALIGSSSSRASSRFRAGAPLGSIATDRRGCSTSSTIGKSVRGRTLVEHVFLEGRQREVGPQEAGPILKRYVRQVRITACVVRGVARRSGRGFRRRSRPSSGIPIEIARMTSQQPNGRSTYELSYRTAHTDTVELIHRAPNATSVHASQRERVIGARDGSVAVAPVRVSRGRPECSCAQTAASTSRTSTVLTVTPSGASGIGGSPTRNMAAAVRASSSVSKTTMATPRPF